MGLSLVMLLIGLIEATLHQLVPSNNPTDLASVNQFPLAQYIPASVTVSEREISTWIYMTNGGVDLVRTVS